MRTLSPRAWILGVFVATAAGCASTVTTLTSEADGGVDVAPDTSVVVPADVSVRRDVSTVADARPDAPVTPRSCSAAEPASVAITYTGPGSAPMDCRLSPTRPSTPPMVVTRTAAVVSVTEDAMGSLVSLDFCSPAADCLPLLGSLRISAPGFTLGVSPVGLRPGQYVQIRSRATWSWGCTMQVEVSNAPTWDGSPNPIRRDASLLAAAASGEAAALPDAPFGVARESIGCAMAGSNCGGGAPELFALAFRWNCNSCLVAPDPVVVEQGRTSSIGLDGRSYVVRNLRSFNTGACDDYWNYAWTAREMWLE